MPRNLAYLGTYTTRRLITFAAAAVQDASAAKMGRYCAVWAGQVCSYVTMREKSVLKPCKEAAHKSFCRCRRKRCESSASDAGQKLILTQSTRFKGQQMRSRARATQLRAKSG